MYQQAIDHLMAAAMAVSPTGKEQQGFSQALSEMHRDGLTSKEIAANLAGMIANGLKTGNWRKEGGA